MLTRNREFRCPCYSTAKYKKIVNLKDSGLVIYNSTSCKQHDTENNFGGTLILQNTKKDMEICSADIMPSLESYEVNCPRCRQNIENAKKLLKYVPTIGKNTLKGICDHCRKKKLRTCQRCDEEIQHFISTREETKTHIRHIETWLSKVIYLLKTAIKKKKQISAHKERAYLSNLHHNSPNASTEDLQIKDYFYSGSATPEFTQVHPMTIGSYHSLPEFSKKENSFANTDPRKNVLWYKNEGSYQGSPHINSDKEDSDSIFFNEMPSDFKIGEKRNNYDYNPKNKILKLRDDPHNLKKPPREQNVNEPLQLRKSISDSSIIRKINILKARKYKSDEAILSTLSGAIEYQFKEGFSYYFPKEQEDRKKIKEITISSSELIKDTIEVLKERDENEKLRLKEVHRKQEEEREKKIIEKEERKKQKKEEALLKQETAKNLERGRDRKISLIEAISPSKEEISEAASSKYTTKDRAKEKETRPLDESDFKTRKRDKEETIGGGKIGLKNEKDTGHPSKSKQDKTISSKENADRKEKQNVSLSQVKLSKSEKEKRLHTSGENFNPKKEKDTGHSTKSKQDKPIGSKETADQKVKQKVSVSQIKRTTKDKEESKKTDVHSEKRKTEGSGTPLETKPSKVLPEGSKIEKTEKKNLVKEKESEITTSAKTETTKDKSFEERSPKEKAKAKDITESDNKTKAEPTKVSTNKQESSSADQELKRLLAERAKEKEEQLKQKKLREEEERKMREAAEKKNADAPKKPVQILKRTNIAKLEGIDSETELNKDDIKNKPKAIGVTDIIIGEKIFKHKLPFVQKQITEQEHSVLPKSDHSYKDILDDSKANIKSSHKVPAVLDKKPKAPINISTKTGKLVRKIMEL